MSMNWRIFVDIAAAKNSVKWWGNSSSSALNKKFTYRLINDNPDASEVLMHTETRYEVAGGEFIDHQGVRPELPAAFVGIVPVLRVTAVGAPPGDIEVIPGLYQIEGATAEVFKNGSKFKIDLTASNCETAWSLYRAILQKDRAAILAD